MGRYAKYAKRVLLEKANSEKCDLASAARKIQGKSINMIKEREGEIANIQARFGNPPEPKEWQEVIGNEQFWIGHEREWMAEFDNLDELQAAPD